MKPNISNTTIKIHHTETKDYINTDMPLTRQTIHFVGILTGTYFALFHKESKLGRDGEGTDHYFR